MPVGAVRRRSALLALAGVRGAGAAGGGLGQPGSGDRLAGGHQRGMGRAGALALAGLAGRRLSVLNVDGWIGGVVGVRYSS
jgi:hypothetical protein